MWRAAVSQAVDQSSTRNKRNDRLAEGHDRVAGTDMVLRIPQTLRPYTRLVTGSSARIGISEGEISRRAATPPAPEPTPELEASNDNSPVQDLPATGTD